MMETLANGYSFEWTQQEPMNTNMAGFRRFSKSYAFLCNLMIGNSALKGLTCTYTYFTSSGVVIPTVGS